MVSNASEISVLVIAMLEILDADRISGQEYEMQPIGRSQAAQQRLYFLPLPHGHGWFLPIFRPPLPPGTEALTGWGAGRCRLGLLPFAKDCPVVTCTRNIECATSLWIFCCSIWN